MPKTLLAGLLVLSLVGCAHAQSWKSEPTVVMDIPIGANLADASVPNCDPPPRGYETSHTRADKKSCIRDSDPMSDTVRTIYSSPNLGFSYEASAGLYAGRIESLTLRFQSVDFDKVAELMIDRYGKPTRSAKTSVGNLAGAALPSRVMSWEGRELSLVLSERVSSMTSGAATFTSRKVAARRASDERSSAKAASGKL